MDRWRCSKVRKGWHVTKADGMESAWSFTSVETELLRDCKMYSAFLVRRRAQTRDQSSWLPTGGSLTYSHLNTFYFLGSHRFFGHCSTSQCLCRLSGTQRRSTLWGSGQALVGDEVEIRRQLGFWVV